MKTLAPQYRIEEGLDPVDWSRVHLWLANSYWSPGIPLQSVQQAARNSALVLGAFCDHEQVGFARVVSDTVRFAYLCDVLVAEGHRGRGVGQAIVQYAVAHPKFQTVKWLLATADAHGVYEKLGFVRLTEPERWMTRPPRHPALWQATPSDKSCCS